MARSWSGFLPQNQNIKDQWRALEASQSEVHDYLNSIVTSKESADGDSEDEENLLDSDGA